MWSSVGRWRHEFDPELLAVCEESFGDVLREFGYGDVTFDEHYGSMPSVSSKGRIVSVHIKYD